MNRLSQLLSIKPGEGRMAALVIAAMLLTAGGAALGGTGIEALFLDHYDPVLLPRILPFMYIGLGLTTMLTSFGVTSILGRIRRETLYSAMPVLIALVLVGARVALISHAEWIYPALWLGKEVANTLMGLVIWGLAGVVCDTRQAKRLFPLFNASRILGQVMAGFSTKFLVGLFQTENLICLWAVTLLAAFLFSRAVLARLNSLPPTRASRHKTTSLTAELQRGYQYVRQSPLMRWISVAAILFSILYFSIHLPFQTAVANQFKDADSKAAFIGLFNGLSTAVSFLLSLLFANRLFSRFGVMSMILALPVIYLLGFGGLMLSQAFLAIVAFRFVQMLWLSGIADPAYQAMFNVVSPERRDQVRTFIGGVPEQAGTFISGALLLIGEQALIAQQLYLIGLAAAAVCILVIWQARQGYNDTLVEALRNGQPHLFFAEEQPFGGFKQDSSAINAALKGMTHADATIRRVAAEILGHLALPEATPALVKGLTDSDAHVRATCIRALSESNASSAFNDIVTALRDPEGDVRVEAVMALTRLTNPVSNSSMVLSILLPPLLNDPDSRVSARAAVALLKIPSRSNVKAMLKGDTAPKSGSHAKAMQFLRQTAMLGELAARLDAIEALGEWKDAEASLLLQTEIEDTGAPTSVRRAALTALTHVDQVKAMPMLLTTLGDADQAVRTKAAELLGALGAEIQPTLLDALNDPDRQDGALTALQFVPDLPTAAIEDYARHAQASALDYHFLKRAIPKHDAPNLLLSDAIESTAHAYGLRVLRAISLLGDREALGLALDELQQPQSHVLANALETIDALTLRWRDIVQPVTRLWDEEALEDVSPKETQSVITSLLSDPSPWLRACAAYAARHRADAAHFAAVTALAESDPDLLVRDAASGVINMNTINTLSIMDRILFLKNVPLFDDLAPSDLKQVAFTATEEVFPAGEVMAYEGDPGDTMFVIVSGEVRVVINEGKDEVELARRKPNEYVGEMAIITNAPRSASLIAVDDVRALCLSQKSFLGLLRDRPEVSLSIIRTLSNRLKELNQKVEALSQAPTN